MKLTIKIILFSALLTFLHNSSLQAMNKCLGGSCNDERSTSSSEEESSSSTQSRHMRRAKSEKNITDKHTTIVPSATSEILPTNSKANSKFKVLILASQARQLERSQQIENTNLRTELKKGKESVNKSDNQTKKNNPARLSSLPKKDNKSNPELRTNNNNELATMAYSAPVISEKDRKKFFKLMNNDSITLEKIKKYFKNPTDYNILLNSLDENKNTPFMIFTQMAAKKITKENITKKDVHKKFPEFINIFDWFNQNQIATSFNWNQINKSGQTVKDIAALHNHSRRLDSVIAIIDTNSTKITEDRIKAFEDYSLSFSKEAEFLKKSQEEAQAEALKIAASQKLTHRRSKSG